MQDFIFDFEKLIVYQKALDFIDEIFKIVKALSRKYRYSLGDNLLRAGLSIANNLAEGNGKRSKKEKNRYFGTSLDSARECISVFNVFKRQNLINKDMYNKIRKYSVKYVQSCHCEEASATKHNSVASSRRYVGARND